LDSLNTEVSKEVSFQKQLKYHSNGILKEKSMFLNGELVNFFYNYDSLGVLVEKRRARILKGQGPVVTEFIVFDSNSQIDFEKSKFIQFIPSDEFDTIYLNSSSKLPIQVNVRFPGNHSCRIFLKYSNNTHEIDCSTNEWILDTLSINEEFTKVEIDVEVEYFPKVFWELYTHRFIKWKEFKASKIILN
jgi:hypothetical protein